MMKKNCKKNLGCVQLFDFWIDFQKTCEKRPEKRSDMRPKNEKKKKDKKTIKTGKKRAYETEDSKEAEVQIEKPTEKKL